jgi:outer membrane protein assembly factor BamB
MYRRRIWKTLDRAYAFMAVALFSLACDAGPGSIEWKVELSSPVRRAPAVAPDGTIWIGTYDGTLYSVSTTGSNLQGAKAGGEAMTPAIGADGTVYFGSTDGKLYAVNPDFTVKWTSALSSGIRCPALGEDGTIYVGGSGTGNVFAVSPSGTTLWNTRTTFTWGVTTPVIGPDGTVYVGGDWGVALLALDPATAQVRWTFSPGAYWDGVAAAVAPGGHIFAITGSLTSTRVYELEPDSGGVVNYWEFYAVTEPVIGNNSVYVWDRSTATLQSIPLSGGNSHGIIGHTGENYLAPAISGSGDLYVPVRDTLYILSSSGSVKSTVVLDASISTPPTIGPDGTVYIGADTKLYAIRGDGMSPANQPWPMYMRDARHTGKAD